VTSNLKTALQSTHNTTSREIISTAIQKTLIALQMMSLSIPIRRLVAGEGFEPSTFGL
jgi:hypothetical protein